MRVCVYSEKRGDTTKIINVTTSKDEGFHAAVLYGRRGERLSQPFGRFRDSSGLISREFAIEIFDASQIQFIERDALMRP